jgi:hypothetical protein
MTEPRRILSDAKAGDLQRSLLMSWSDERPSDRARARTLAALGLGAAPLALPAAAAATAPKTALVTLVAKWSAIGLVAFGTTAAAVGYARMDGPEPQASSANKARAVANANGAAPARPANATPPSAMGPANVKASAPANVGTPGRETASAARGHTRAPAPASSLDAQLSSLARARESLAAGRPDTALASLDDYDARYHGGAFAQEAYVLRVQALIAQGDRAGAQRVATRFLAAYPQSPHAARVRSLVSSSP